MDFTNLKVLVVGDLCLDVIIDGPSTRLSPEAPVPVIKNPETTYSLGMAGNVAVNLKGLGADVYLSSIFKYDEYGKIVEDLLINNGIKPLNFIRVKIDGATTVKKRILANGKHVARIDIERKINLAEEYFKKYYETIPDIKFDLVIVSDYNKGYIDMVSWKYLQRVAWERNKGRIFVDTKKINPAAYYEGCILFPNTTELENLLYENSCSSAYEMLLELDTDILVETQSERGAIAYTKNNIVKSHATTKTAVDVTGAGDTFIAAFALYYTKFGNTQRALDFANYCCGKVVQKKGTVPIHIREVMNF